MKTSLKEEFEAIAIAAIHDGRIQEGDDYAFTLFEEDYYIVGYHDASKWLKEHNFGELEAVNICINHDMGMGIYNSSYTNAETLVNKLAPLFGLEWIEEEGQDFIDNYLEEQAEENEDEDEDEDE